MASQPLLELENISCGYQDNQVIDDFSVQLQEGEIACFLGPSGCGKTTLLRAIAGFEPITSGIIKLKQTIISSPRHLTLPENRKIGFVFQDYALFPHLNVEKNISFGLKNLSRAARENKVAELLALTGLEQFSKRLPQELSGGQQQRVALARALAPSPQILLLDEPFSNLDVELRRRLSIEVRNILKQSGTSAILVTHDQHEAFAMADQVGIINQGRLLQWDTPYTMYHQPADPFVAGFVGRGHFIRGIAKTSNSVDTEAGTFSSKDDAHWQVGTSLDILIRPDDVVLDDNSNLKGKIISKTFQGESTLYTLQLPSGNVLEALFPSHENYEIGSVLAIRLNIAHMVAFVCSS